MSRRWLVALAVAAIGCSDAPAPAVAPVTTTTPAPVAADLEPGFFYAPVGDDRTLVSVDWSGRMGAPFRTAEPVGCCVFQQSADGSAFAMITTVYDRTGAALGDLPVGGVLSEDGREVCGIRGVGPDPFPLEAEVVHGVLGAQPDEVDVLSPVNGFGPHTDTQVLACSEERDEVVVATRTLGQIAELHVFRLTDGTDVTPPIYPLPAAHPCFGSGSMSGDGSTIAGSFAVCDAHDGSVLAHQAHQIEALSWDGSLAVELVPPGPDPAADPFRVQVVEWRTGLVLWTSPPPQPRAAGSVLPPMSIQAEPRAGGALAIAIDLHAEPSSADGCQLWLVPQGGPPRLLTDDAASGVI
jgi:hypothetical protein